MKGRKAVGKEEVGQGKGGKGGVGKKEGKGGKR